MQLKSKLFRTTLSILLVLILTISCIPISASATTLDVVSIDVKPITLMTQTNGYIRNEYDFDAELFHKYYYYEPENVMEYTITLSNGTTITNSGDAFVYNGEWYYLDCETNQNSKNQWIAGNIYTMTVSLSGISVDVPVTIIENQFESIEIEPISIIEGNCGFYTEDYNYETDEWDLEYYCYTPKDALSYTINLKDGTTITNTGDFFKYDGKTYYLECDTKQDYENIWTAGNTYTMTVSLSDISVDVPVIITKSPFENIEVKPISIAAYNNGDFHHDYNPETDDYDLKYYCYYPQDLMEYTLTLNDGSTISGTGTEFDYNGIIYNFAIKTAQDYQNQWTAGNTYTMEVSFNNISADVPVTISGSPYKSVEIEPISIIEDTCGLYIKHYNPETDKWDLGYYCYCPEDLMKYTITLNDGTIITGTGPMFYNDGEVYYLDYSTSQGYENQWTAGNTYTMTVTLADITVDVPVTITSSNPTSTLKGDVDNDGAITIKDATIVQEHISRYQTLTGQLAINADVDGSGDINIVDASYIQMHVSKAIDNFDNI